MPRKKQSRLLAALRVIAVAVVAMVAAVGVVPQAAHAAITPAAAIQIKVANSNKCLNVDHGLTTDDAAVVQYFCSDSFANDKWRIVPQGTGTFWIVANYDGKCLNVYKAATTDGTPVHQYGCTTTGTNNLWRIVPMPGKTTFHIISVASGKCLNIKGNASGGVTTDGAPLIIYPCSNTALNDQFYLPPATSGALSAPLPAVADTPIVGVQGGTNNGVGPLVYAYVDNLGRFKRGYQSDPENFTGVIWTTENGLQEYSGHPAANVQADGRVQLAARHWDDGDLWLETQNAKDSSVFADWQDVGGSGIGQPVTGKLPNGRLVGFAIVNGQLWHLPQDGTNVPYGAWRYIGGTDLVGEPVVAPTQIGLRVYALDKSGALQTALYADGKLGDWTSLDGTGLTGAPAVLALPGFVDRVVMRATDGTLVTKMQHIDGTFDADWTTLSGVEAAGQPALVLDPKTGRTVIVVRATDHTVYYTSETGQATGAFNEWKQVFATSVATDPTIFTYNKTTGQAFGYVVRDDNQQVYFASTEDVPAAAATSGKATAAEATLTFTEHRLPKPPAN